MSVTARDVMETRYRTLSPQTPITEAVKILEEASEQRGQRVFGIMVTDEEGHLVGMLSMYDILLLMRPKHIHIWGEMKDIDTNAAFTRDDYSLGYTHVLSRNEKIRLNAIDAVCATDDPHATAR